MSFLQLLCLCCVVVVVIVEEEKKEIQTHPQKLILAHLRSPILYLYLPPTGPTWTTASTLPPAHNMLIFTLNSNGLTAEEIVDVVNEQLEQAITHKQPLQVICDEDSFETVDNFLNHMKQLKSTCGIIRPTLKKST